MKKDMYLVEYRSFVGVLFDVVKIKEDFVYDKYLGEYFWLCEFG